MRKGHKLSGTIDFDISSQSPFGKKTSQTTIPRFQDNPQSKTSLLVPCKAPSKEGSKSTSKTKQPKLCLYGSLHPPPTTQHPTPLACPASPYLTISNPSPQSLNKRNPSEPISDPALSTHNSPRHQPSPPPAPIFNGYQNGGFNAHINYSGPRPTPNIATKVCSASWVVSRSL